MGNIKKIKKKISEDLPVIGTSVTFNDSAITELLSYVGFDFIWIDNEHSSLDKRDTQLHIMATRGSGAAAFVRVPWNDPVLVKPILEMGADGIIFPFINTPENAKKAVSSCLYPPFGSRGFGPIRANKYGMVKIDEYINNAASQIWKIMQIETKEAVDNLDQILMVEGIDAIVIGPNDLSASIGLLGQTEHKEVKKLMDIIGEKIKDSKIPFGVAMKFDPVGIKEWLDRGIKWIELAGDFRYLVQAAQNSLESTKNIFSKNKNL